MHTHFPTQINTLTPGQNGCGFVANALKYMFLVHNSCTMGKKTLQFVPKSPNDKKKSALLGAKLLHEQIMIRSFTPHCEMAAILFRPQCVNLLRPKENGRHFEDGIFKLISLNRNIWISSNISLKFFLKWSFNNDIGWVREIDCHRTDHKPFSKPMMA